MWFKKDTWDKISFGTSLLSPLVQAFKLENLTQKVIVHEGTISGYLNLSTSPENIINQLMERFKLGVIDKNYPFASRAEFDKFHCHMVNDKTLVYFSANGTRKEEMVISGYCYSNDFEQFKEILKLFNDNVHSKPEKKGPIYALVSEEGKLDFNLIGYAARKLEKGNYAPSVLDCVDKVLTEFPLSAPSGRLAIFRGPPGSGKSFLIRGMLEASHPNCVFVLLSPDDIVHTTNPSFLPALINLKNDCSTSMENAVLVLLVEDADRCLVPRGGDNIGFVSALLNMTDGIIGEILNLRVICTTNADMQQFDEALMRPGRLLVVCDVEEIDREQAMTIYKRLGGKNVELLINQKYTLAEIYQLALSPPAEKIKQERKFGF